MPDEKQFYESSTHRVASEMRRYSVNIGEQL